MTELQIDVWADIVCPWCYVGEARLEKAAAAIAGDARVTITPHAFKASTPTTPTQRRCSTCSRANTAAALATP